MVLRDFAKKYARRYFGVQFYLEDMLDRPVDLVTEKALRTERAQHHHQGPIDAAEKKKVFRQRRHGRSLDIRTGQRSAHQ